MRKQLCMMVLAGLVLASVPAMADKDGDIALASKMGQRVTVDFSDTPLEDVVDFLKSVTRINIVMDAKARAAGHRITLSVNRLRLRNVLALVQQFTGLHKRSRDGVLMLTADPLPTRVETKIYDVNDLLFTIKDFKGPSLSLNKNRASGVGVIVFGGDDDDDDTGLDKDTLLELIKSNIDPSSWEDEKSAASILRGQLVVTQSAAAQVEIAKLLRMLRLER